MTDRCTAVRDRRAAGGAFRDLDTAFAQRSIWIIYVSDFGELAPIRGDPRYAALLKRLGLPDVRAAK